MFSNKIPNYYSTRTFHPSLLPLRCLFIYLIQLLSKHTEENGLQERRKTLIRITFETNRLLSRTSSSYLSSMIFDSLKELHRTLKREGVLV